MTREDHKKYANDVLAGKIRACEHIKNACRRYLSFFDKYEYRDDEVNKVINFIQKLKHFTGKHNGKNFILSSWQVWIISSIFGFYKSDGSRLTNTVYCELARKNGKTAFISAISLYCLAVDEHGAEVDCLANSAKQANILFQMSCNFASSIDPKNKYFKRYRSMIKFDKTKSFMQVLAADASGNDGYNSSFFCLDEAHEQRDSRLWDVMASSQGMRENPLGVIITTAGFNKYLFCYEFRKTCVEILSGVTSDDSTFAAIYTLDEGDDWKDENNWIKSNPNLGITVQKEYISRQIKQAELNPSLEIGVRTKNLNIWCDTSEIWISNELLLKHTEQIDFNQFEEESVCFVAVDLAAVSDLTAMSVFIPYEGKFYFKTFYYLPESTLVGNPNSRIYMDWKNQGYLKITPGNVTDYDYVTRDILALQENFLIDHVYYDPYNATQWAIDATNAGLPLESFNQNIANFNRPTKEFERSLKLGRVIIDDNPITRWCFSNVSLKEDHCSNMKPFKGEGKAGKIDGVISMLEALGGYLLQPQYSNEIVAM